jgi:hypothetical protein
MFTVTLCNATGAKQRTLALILTNFRHQLACHFDFLLVGNPKCIKDEASSGLPYRSLLTILPMKME